MTKEESKDADLPEDMTIEIEEEKVNEGKSESRISNNLLWGLFMVVAIAFASIPFLNPAVELEMQTVTVNGINISSAIGEPKSSIRSITNRHIVGKTLDGSKDAKNALLEIGTIIGKSNLVTYGGEYSMAVGLSDRTGIFIGKQSASIEGKTKEDFWEAVWVFNSVVADIGLDSEVDMYSIQDKISDKSAVSLVIDLDDACPNYGGIISATGDILQSLGYRQPGEGYTIYQYNESRGECWLQFSFPEENLTARDRCPEASPGNFVIIVAKGEEGRIGVDGNEMLFSYEDCDSLFKTSVIVRDMLAPNVISATRDVKFPTVID